MANALLLPAVVLILWSLIMLVWMAATRVPAAKKLGVDIGASVGGRGGDLDPQVPAPVAWKSHNYTHLMEQPTLFYATVVILAHLGADTATNVALAWGYVGLRIAHSLWQVLINKVSVRFVLFVLSTLCLLGLAINALLMLL
ncbi:MAG: MAPEG family protein [Pseudomonadales bacterium]